MKKTLISLGVLWLTLFSPPSLTADLAVPASLGPTQASVSLVDVRPAAHAVQLQFAAIGDPRSTRLGTLRDADRPAEKPVVNPAAEGLPSTPVALASLLLILCILIGRRNGAEHV